MSEQDISIVVEGTEEVGVVVEEPSDNPIVSEAGADIDAVSEGDIGVVTATELIQGPPGPTGPPGPEGPKGESGGGLYHYHVQSVPSDDWVIVHNLGVRPSVTTVDSAGTVVEGHVSYLDDNSVRVRFETAFAGEAYLN